MSVKILCDSAADFTPEQKRKYNIDILPLTVTLGDKSYRDCVDIFPSDIFKHVDNGGALPKTSAVSVQEFHDAFARYSKEFDTVINVDIAAPLSACYQNACIAAEDFENVFVVDSKALSAAESMIAIAGAEVAAVGLDGKATYEFMLQCSSKIKTTFIVDRLDYLVKGGRCSSLTALGANLLKIKPEIVQGEDGRLSVGKKYRGSFTKALVDYAEDILRDPECLDTRRCFVVHPDAPRDSVNAAIRRIKELVPFEDVSEVRAGCTIASHCGPVTVGIMVFRK